MARHGHRHKSKDLREYGENRRRGPATRDLLSEGYGHKHYAATAQHMANREAAKIRMEGGQTRKIVYGRKRNAGQPVVQLWFKGGAE